jgi:hypothetical protein
MFYAVSINRKSWTQREVTIEALQARGFRVTEARRCGEFDVSYDGFKVAILFSSKADAAQYALGK